MDDFIHEDAAALYDFGQSYPIEVEFFAQTAEGGGHPAQVFGRIRRIPYEPPA